MNALGGTTLEAISESMLDFLGSEFFLFAHFARNFSADIRARGDRVVTRVPSSLATMDLSGGYGSPGDQTSTAVEVELSNFRGHSAAFSDFEISKLKSQTILERTFLRPALNATAKAVADSLLGLVVNSNFSASQTVTEANFDADNMHDAAATLTDNGAPLALRSAMLKSGYASSLLKDAAIMDSSRYGSTEPVRDGVTSAVAGMGVVEYDELPANSENLAGFACHPSALCIAARTPADPEAPGVEVISSVEKRTGLPVQMRKFYDRTQGKHYITFSILYGVAPGNSGALVKFKTS